ncbi:replication initiator protein A [Pseudomonas sp. Q1-7]|uniref:replication initiator protein A n=1 Tax=Pseudomonas sp. Q1-7 TaxID=3020843 RepID=UPI0023001B21|nr:replication initiator protein A [Pseudomonas sp. Q1-7]
MHEACQAESTAQTTRSRFHAILDRRVKEAAERKELKNELQNELNSPRTVVAHVQGQFPFLPAMASALPTLWTRTSLFSSLRKGERRILKNQKLEGRVDCIVRVSGEELDLYDNDVFLRVVQLAQGTFPGEPLYFERSSFLRAIGRGSDLSSESYRRLQDSMERLARSTIFVEGQEGGESFRLIDKIKWGVNGNYYITMDPVIISAFINPAFIDMGVRFRLKSPLAKYLQNYISGHAVGVHRIACEKLRNWSGSQGRLRDFCSRLRTALGELESEGIIRDWEIEDDVARWTRNPHPKSKKY